MKSKAKRNKKWPTYWSQWFNKFAIRPGTLFCEPIVVYITHCDNSGHLQGQVLRNPDELLIASPGILIEYSPRLFMRLMAQWQYSKSIDEIKKSKKQTINGKPRNIIVV